MASKRNSVLVLGAGFVGCHVVRYLVDQGQDVVMVKRKPSKLPSFLVPFENKEVKQVLGDVMDLPFLYGLIKNCNVESVVHLAAVHEKSARSLYEAVKINTGSVLEVLEAARVFGLRRVTVASSSTVYMPSIVNPEAFQEDQDLPLRPLRYVSATKKGAEQICLLYARELGMSVPMVRPANVWGPLYSSGRQPTQMMVENAVVGKPSDYSGTCGQTKTNHIYVKDCARAFGMVHLAPKLKHDVYNVEDGTVFSLDEFAAAIKDIIPTAQFKLGTTRGPKDSDVPVMSIRRIKEDLGWVPRYNLHDALVDYIAWLKEGKY